ncbi:hypothetical protein V8C35DRAFT_215770 [Trichoderma chlorosporum]
MSVMECGYGVWLWSAVMELMLLAVQLVSFAHDTASGRSRGKYNESERAHPGAFARHAHIRTRGESRRRHGYGMLRAASRSPGGAHKGVTPPRFSRSRQGPVHEVGEYSR